MTYQLIRLYPNNLKNLEFGKEAPQNFCSERATIAQRQGASENENYEAKPTPPKTNFSSCLGITHTIHDQLLLEEDLLRHKSDNYILINSGTTPAIVLGISGHAPDLVHLDKLPPSIPLIRRFSGGGTVIVDEETIFVTFICNKSLHPFAPYPEPILRWAASMLQPSIPNLQLQDNDFVIDGRKCGGNALYIKKDRWLIHTSLLWNYTPERMQLLKYPPKTPPYRAGRSHDDFLCKLSDLFPCKQSWLNTLARSFSLNNS